MSSGTRERCERVECLVFGRPALAGRLFAHAGGPAGGTAALAPRRPMPTLSGAANVIGVRPRLSATLAAAPAVSNMAAISAWP